MATQQAQYIFKDYILGDFDFSTKDKLKEFILTDPSTSRRRIQEITCHHDDTYPLIPEPFKPVIQDIIFTRHEVNHAERFDSYSTYAEFKVIYTICLYKRA